MLRSPPEADDVSIPSTIPCHYCTIPFSLLSLALRLPCGHQARASATMSTLWRWC